jgi:chitin disaccharide deacetylase
MTPNPLLKKLGYSSTDRLVIIHVDDVGMCHASLQGFIDLWEFGTISSGAVMVPCPWFPATAEWACQNPGVDLGVHGTVNSEWDGYRWGPVSTREQASGLIDAEGYFHKREPAVWDNADPEAVRIEVESQAERALAAGIDVTHIDTHMGTITNPKFIGGYLQALTRFQVPGLLPRQDAAGFMALGFSEEEATIYAAMIQQLEEQGFPMIDGIDLLSLEDPANQIEATKQKLSNLPAGITHFLMHPAIDTPELRAIAPDWECRVANYKAFMSQEIKDFLRNDGIQLIGYRAIRNVMRKQS